jgi:hypothetical protein
MSAVLVLLTLLAYMLAAFLFHRERTLRYFLMLLAGHIAMLMTPLWERLYQLQILAGPGGISLFGLASVSWTLVLGGGTLLVLPPLLFYYGLRHRWWPFHYAILWAAYVIFALYFLLLEWIFADTISLEGSTLERLTETPLTPVFVLALLLASVDLGMVYVLVSTRHYALQIAVIPLLLSGVVSMLLFLGIFASPLWIFSLIDIADQPLWVTLWGVMVSLVLVLWGIHLLASGLHAGRDQQVVWR